MEDGSRMKLDFLDFEQPIAELEAKINELRHLDGGDMNLLQEIASLEEKRKNLTESTFKKLTDVQIAKVSRHPQRPYALDYIPEVFTDFKELHGDRAFADDEAIVAGLARLDGQPVMVITQEKGRDTKEKIRRNFGMPRPEGYRKALRLMKMAERFGLPVVTFIDTPGAYPGINAEERGQSEAIARNLIEMAELKVPIICTVIGEGGSGGALAIGVGDVTMIMEYGTFSVISPEGCASILWKNAANSADAAEALGITAKRLKTLGLVDEIIPEPLGGAHRDHKLAASNLKKSLIAQVNRLKEIPVEALVETRYQRYMGYGNFELS
jgi:acetyl-CoA carboxylase carboxyl transferase subunit alpha